MCPVYTGGSPIRLRAPDCPLGLSRSISGITGCVYSSTAIFSLLQYPLQTLTTSTFDGNPFWSSTILVSLCAPIFLLLLEFSRRYRKRSVSAADRDHESAPLLGSTKELEAAGATPLLISGSPARPTSTVRAGRYDSDAENTVSSALSSWVRSPVSTSIGGKPRRSLSASYDKASPRRSASGYAADIVGLGMLRANSGIEISPVRQTSVYGRDYQYGTPSSLGRTPEID